MPGTWYLLSEEIDGWMDGVYRGLGTMIPSEGQLPQSYLVNLILMESKNPEQIRNSRTEGAPCQIPCISPMTRVKECPTSSQDALTMD